MAAAVPVRSLRDLRQVLADRFPEARPLVERDAARLAGAVRTGIGMLDAILPGGGFPRGKLTVWAPEGGAAAVLRATCRALFAEGERAAWVDASRTLTFGWLDAGARGSLPSRGTHAPHAPHASHAPPALPDDVPLVVHPADRLQALRATELLLRSGAFALVVLDGAPPEGTETVRLTRSARDGGGAFVVLTPGTSMAAVRITSRLLPSGARWVAGPFGDPALLERVRASVRVRALGWNAHAEVAFPVGAYDVRCAVAPGPDRRGAGREPRDGRRVRPDDE